MCPAQNTAADALLNPLLVTFRHVAASGSFNRAAEGLFLSATAVRKQMNLLEDALGLPLFTRGKKGIRLTGEGKTLLEGLAQLSGAAADVLARARHCAGGAAIRVGTSFLNPATVFIDLLRALGAEGEHAVELVPFDDGRDGILAEIGRLGRDYDFLVGACDSKRWMQRCHFQKLGEYAMCCAVPRGHRLARKRRLALGDLAGEAVVLGARGDSSTVDGARELLLAQEGIRLEDGPFFYDLDIFNACAREGKILLTLECWRNAHPAFVTVPVAWDLRVPWGLLYEKEPSEKVRRFLEGLGARAGYSAPPTTKADG
ncbi:MAG: LysR family transcriptional regulator [Desulfovibrio sp.]|nr:LysR family transcriptional regulator [Desulfovibrio sp.]